VGKELSVDKGLFVNNNELMVKEELVLFVGERTPT
jgi:hypothetical protein